MKNYIILMVLVGFFSIAFAQFFPTFDNLDKDKDGKITKEEWPGKEKGFNRFDRNRDGIIERKEYPQGNFFQQGRRSGKMQQEGMQREGMMREGMMREGMPLAQHPLMKLDTNQDGKISKKEYMENFKRMDVDGDGYITQKEMPKMPQGRKRGEANKQWEQKGQQRFNQNMDPQKKWEMMDKNQDAKVDRLEWQGPPEKFDQFDRNHDGFITPEDWQRPQWKHPGRKNPKEFDDKELEDEELEDE